MPGPKLFGIEEERIPHLRCDSLARCAAAANLGALVERAMLAKVEHWANLETGGFEKGIAARRIGGANRTPPLRLRRGGHPGARSASAAAPGAAAPHHQ